MGLNMYAFFTDAPLSSKVDFHVGEDAGWEIQYWRKHPNLHGWMHALYLAKGGEKKNFNAATVALDIDDLDVLEKCILEDRLPFTTGCFFGSSDGWELEDDLVFVARARKLIKGGKSVFYTARW